MLRMPGWPPNPAACARWGRRSNRQTWMPHCVTALAGTAAGASIADQDMNHEQSVGAASDRLCCSGDGSRDERSGLRESSGLISATICSSESGSSCRESRSNAILSIRFVVRRIAIAPWHQSVTCTERQLSGQFGRIRKHRDVPHLAAGTRLAFSVQVQSGVGHGQRLRPVRRTVLPDVTQQVHHRSGAKLRGCR